MAPSVIVVGTSLGGLSALQTLLKGLPKEFPVPVIIVQHRGKEPDEALSKLLQDHCELPVGEPEDKEAIVRGRVYVAPADYHLLVEQGGLALSTEGAVNHARPSVDVLFESAADTYGNAVVGVVLTGANQDGAQGAAKIKERGGLVVVQDPATAESRAMPEGAVAVANVDKILPLTEISCFLVGLCEPTGRSLQGSEGGSFGEG